MRKVPNETQIFTAARLMGFIGGHSALEEQIQSIYEATPGSYLYGQIGE